MLSATLVNLSRHYTRARTNENVKLVHNLMKKVKYTCHYLLLRFFLEHGMKLTKDHRIIQFKKSGWMHPFIALNTLMRMRPTNDMENDFLKLRNKAVYGNTCENQRELTDIHLGDRLKAVKLAFKPHCIDVRVFDEQLLGIELRKVKLLLNKPSYVGFPVLELSKPLMMRCAIHPF